MPRLALAALALAAPALLAGCNRPVPSISADRAATSDAAATPAASPHFQALGTEPFWSFDVSADKLIYSSPEKPDGVPLAATFIPEGKGYRYRAVMDGMPLELAIQPGTCGDGMSDTSYAYTAIYTLGSRAEHGCARLK